MKRFDGNPGDTVWFSEMYEEKTAHLCVLITPPERNSSRAVIVNLTSQRRGSDNTVVFQQGDHPFIKRPTVVNYQAARIVSVAWVQKEIDCKMAWADCPFEPPMLKRIQDGVLKSPFIPGDIKKHFLKTMHLCASQEE